MREATRLTGVAVKIAGDTLTTTQQSNAQQRLDNSASALDAKTIADRNAAQADKSFQSTIDNFHQDQRAWVGLDTIEGQPILSKPFKIDIKLRNTGHTPAKKVLIYSFYEPLLIGSGKEITTSGENEPRNLGLIQPGATPGFLIDPQPSKIVEQADIDRLSKYTIYVHGTITYEDVFGGHHWTTYCAYYIPTAPLYGICENHNDAGDGERPK